MEYSQLTASQRQVLEIVVEYVLATGKSPAIRDILARSNIHSLRGVTLQLDVLQKAGYLWRDAGRRGIFLNPSLLKPADQTIKVPLMLNTIECGSPSEAESDTDGYVTLPLSMTRGLQNVFTVRSNGDSMIEADIESGDIAVLAVQNSANDGDIVAAFVENKGVTLKKFRIVEGRPILFPANHNPKYHPIFDNFVIQGKLINLIKGKDFRKYRTE